MNAREITAGKKIYVSDPSTTIYLCRGIIISTHHIFEELETFEIMWDDGTKSEWFRIQAYYLSELP